ncbi:hypothetical protein QFC19_008572 [Naganishia cerealis]|uniref:Uncharacterized protein n=1 Tax=Naganishia cerealis TaxID=610337 RepID=A0ACC2V184_9TREE|nr:hypothetical protein QFC19_008572 [Naganishia cerealis]
MSTVPAYPGANVDEKEKSSVLHFENSGTAEYELEKQPAHLHGKVEEMDEAARIMAEAGKVDYTLQEDKAVLRKIDTWILPVLCLVYWVQQLDKASVSYAAVFDLRK